MKIWSSHLLDNLSNCLMNLKNSGDSTGFEPMRSWKRGFSGHCINIPQNIRELAHSLPRYPKDLPVIVVRKKGKGNDFKNLIVWRKVVSDAIHWLLRHNPLYSDIEINYNALVSLPENEVPQQLLSIQTEEKVIDDTLQIVALFMKKKTMFIMQMSLLQAFFQ